jgi:hypothetical protein
MAVMIKLFKRLLPAFIKKWYKYLKIWRNKSKNTKEIFTEIKEKNLWGSAESVSGSGSVLNQTETLIIELSKLLKDRSIKTFLDIPCGDFNWMKKVDLSGINYTGADIVESLINENTKKYEKDGMKFFALNIINDILPNNDIIFVRDCFVHLSYKNIFEAVENIKKSGSRYLLATTFTGVNKNYDIITGDWRPLNLEKKPFMFPKPEHIIIEGCTEGNGKYKDKSMGLWEIKKLLSKKNGT